jgi:hypothetical protein
MKTSSRRIAWGYAFLKVFVDTVVIYLVPATFLLYQGLCVLSNFSSLAFGYTFWYFFAPALPSEVVRLL